MTMGDCWRDCLARLTGVAVVLVPDFVNEDPEYWLADTAHWLHSQGLDLVALVPVQAKPPVAIEVAQLVQPRPPYIAVGTVGWNEAYHAVVFDADGQLYDPAGRDGLAVVVGMYWVVPHRRNV